MATTTTLTTTAKDLLTVINARLHDAKLNQLLNHRLAPFAGAALAYWLLVRLLRFRRRNSFARRYGYCTRASLSSMTVADAQAINKELSEQEFPTIFSSSVFFALLKTYGIPTISSLLAATDQLSGDKTVSKRASDTGTIMGEVILNAPASERAADAIARMNFLHSRYRKAGKISDDDMLYTLSLFALEPIRWADKYDWRQLTQIERCALGVFWRDVGRAMEIPYAVLASRVEGDEQDGLMWINALDDWSRSYEENCMVPTDDNEKVASRTIWVAFYNTPAWAKPFVVRSLSALLEPRLRVAVRLPEPNWYHSAIVHSLVAIRRFIIRNFHLPRPYFMRTRFLADGPDPKTGRYTQSIYVVFPWYVKPTLSSRWGFSALQTRLLGGILPGDDGEKYCPQGWIMSEVGPDGMQGKGEAEMAKNKQEILVMKVCPVAPFRSKGVM